MVTKAAPKRKFVGESDEDEPDVQVKSKATRNQTSPRQEDKKPKKPKRKYSSSEDSSEGGYYESNASKAKPIIRGDGDPLSKPKKEDTKVETKKAPAKPETKRVFVDDESDDDGLDNWRS